MDSNNLNKPNQPIQIPLEEWQTFLDKGIIPEYRQVVIALKIKQGLNLLQQEVAMYQANSSPIELLLLKIDPTPNRS